MKSCFIFGAMPVENLIEKPKEGDLILACDKGAESAEGLGIVPHRIIGDFDSLGYVPEGENTIVLPVMKDDTDLAYAVKYAQGEGIKRMCIYGALGGKQDHNFANLQLSVYMSKRGIDAVFYGDGYAITTVTDGVLELNGGEISGRISVFAVGGEANGVTLEGMKYPLNDYTLAPDFPLGVSNEATAEKVKITVKQGSLTVMWEI